MVPTGHPITLVHGDYRLDNLFFDATGAITAIDWQIAAKASAVTTSPTSWIRSPRSRPVAPI